MSVTPIEFPAPMGGWPQTIIAEQIESVDRNDYYNDQATLCMVSGRRISIGCPPHKAREMIEAAMKKAP